MKISDKQILAMFTYLIQVSSGLTGDEISILSVSKDGMNRIDNLLNEIVNQQSEELKEIE